MTKTNRKKRRANELGERVRNLRERLGLTQAEVAARAGLAVPALCRIETGSAAADMIRLGSIRRLSGVLGVSTDSLFGVSAPSASAAIAFDLEGPDEARLITTFRSLGREQRARVLDFIAFQITARAKDK